MKSKHALQTIIILGAAVLAFSSQGQLLYDNGPIGNPSGSYFINYGATVSDSFTLVANSTVANATIGTMTHPGDSFSSVQWSITTAPFGGTTLASGTATTSDTFLFTWSGAYSVDSVSFSITPTALAAGTYWFQLGNAVTAGNSYAFWDINSGPSSAYDYSSISQPVPSESFQLYGVVPTPEPSTMALALVGGLSLVCFRRRK